MQGEWGFAVSVFSRNSFDDLFPNDKLRRAVLSLMPPVSRPRRNGHPSTSAAFDQFSPTRFIATNKPICQTPKRWPHKDTNVLFHLGAYRQSFLARLRQKIRRDIYIALCRRNLDEAIEHMWRFVSFPLESETNRCWRIAYLHEGLGEIDKACVIYEQQIDRCLAQGNLDGAATFIRAMSQADPSRLYNRRRLAELYFSMGKHKSALEEFGRLEMLYWQQGDFDISELMAGRVADQAKELAEKYKVTGTPKPMTADNWLALLAESD